MATAASLKKVTKLKKFTKSVLSLVLVPGLVSAQPPEVVAHLSQAIQFPTISHQAPNQLNEPVFEQFRAFLSRTYPETFSRLQVNLIADHSLLMVWQGHNRDLKPVLFDAHYDVVPIEPGTENDWSYPPFAGTVADGYLWGRGALDDKPAVIATFEALEGLVKEGFQPQRTLLFSFAHDEEVGGYQGAANISAFIQQQFGELEYMVAEGGMVLRDAPMINGGDVAVVGLAEKTYVTLTLKARGEGGHSSQPVQDNAIVNLSRALTALHERPFAPRLVSPVSDMLAVMGEHTDGVKGLLLRNQWLSRPILAWSMGNDPSTNPMVRDTTAVTMFDAGIKENVISQQAQATVNFRLLPGLTPDQLIEAVKDIVADPSIDISAGPSKAGPPVSDPQGLGYQRIESAVTSVLPEIVVSPWLLTASTDTPHYQALTKGIYRFHPYTLAISDTSSIHGTDERISIDSLQQSVQLSRELIRSAAAR